ncbi:MAG TPA: TRAP transporter small permease subunit, partial [Chloroflexota bacterium]|nr:TRAP transporter small permease subunit [Chloroflexota bacterium]
PALRVLIALGGSLIFYIMITEGWMLTLLNRNQVSPAIGVIMTIPYLVIPLSGLLMLFFTWADFVMHARGFDPHDHEEQAELTSQGGF